MCETKEIDGKEYVPAEEYNNLEKEVEYLICKLEESEKKLNHSIELPDCRPITVARVLIDMKRTFDETGIYGHGFDKRELRQIAEHLLVYCNGGEKDDQPRG